MKIYVKALNERGRKAIERHIKDTARLGVIDKIQASTVVKHKVMSENPLTVRLKPSRTVLMAAKMTPHIGARKYKNDFLIEIHKTMKENGASPNDYEVTNER